MTIVACLDGSEVIDEPTLSMLSETYLRKTLVDTHHLPLLSVPLTVAYCRKMYGLRASSFLALLAAVGSSLGAQGDYACSDVSNPPFKRTINDSRALYQYLCVSASVNSNKTVTYVLQSTGKAELGWFFAVYQERL